MQPGRVPGGQRRHVAHAEVLEHQAEHGADPGHPRQVGLADEREQLLGADPGLAREPVPVPGPARGAQELAAGGHPVALERGPNPRGEAAQLAERQPEVSRLEAGPAVDHGRGHVALRAGAAGLVRDIG